MSIAILSFKKPDPWAVIECHQVAFCLRYIWEDMHDWSWLKLDASRCSSFLATSYVMGREVWQTDWNNHLSQVDCWYNVWVHIMNTLLHCAFHRILSQGEAAPWWSDSGKACNYKLSAFHCHLVVWIWLRLVAGMIWWLFFRTNQKSGVVRRSGNWLQNWLLAFQTVEPNS